MHYLTELGAEDQIRLHARSDDFKAISEAHRAKFVKSTRAGLSGLLPVIAGNYGCFATSIRRATARQNRKSATEWLAQLHSPGSASPHPTSPLSRYTGCTVLGMERKRDERAPQKRG